VLGVLAALGVLGLAIAKRSILLLNLHQIDQHVFSPNLKFLVESVRYRFVEAPVSRYRDFAVVFPFSSIRSSGCNILEQWHVLWALRPGR
jgi:hypothetical protein